VGEDTPFLWLKGRDNALLGSREEKREMKKLKLTRGVTFVILNLGDCILTTVALQHGLVEANPIWSHYSIWLKMPLAIVVAVALQRRPHVLRVLNIGMAIIVTWNLAAIIQGVS
jgi:hypothetical protein